MHRSVILSAAKNPDLSGVSTGSFASLRMTPEVFRGAHEVDLKPINSLILRDFEKGLALTASDLTKKYKISRQAIHRHLSDLMIDGKILKQGSSKKTAFYILNTWRARKKIFKKIREFKKKVRAKGLSEDLLLQEVGSQAGLLEGLSKEARTNFDYAFTEMVNNAIDHSQTRFINVDVKVDLGMVWFCISDAGVGIFQNIKEKYKLEGEMAAIQDLLKGKQTTMPRRHTGEGIFFASKIADRFVIDSHKKRLTVDNNINDVFVEDIRFKKGTRVTYEMRADTRKKLDEVFRQFTGENFKFDKSQVKVSLFAGGELYISRSQAKRLLHALDRFNEVILDFANVPTIGQAFADEVFRVFKNIHPEIRIMPISCSENVDFMIKRAMAVGIGGRI